MALVFAQNCVALARFLFILKSVRFNFHGDLNYIYTLAGVSIYV
jgi:hypothetical protein